MSASIKSPDQTRQALLQAAFSEIHHKGFQAASLSQILADTGLTKGALYHHFPDKQALGLAVIDDVVRPMLAAMLFEPLAGTERPLAAMRALLKAKASDPDPWVVTLGCPLNNLMQEMSPVDETFRLRLNALFQDWVAVVAAALKRGKRAGEVKKSIDADATAFFIVSALEGCIGMSKNTQSVDAYRGCLKQLSRYLDTLKARIPPHRGINPKECTMESHQELDARGLNCPLPILKTKKALAGLDSGQVLKVISTDPGSVKDMQAFAKQTGNELLSSAEAGGEFVFFLRRH